MADGESGIFNAKDGVVASTDPGWLQSAFDFVTGLFEWVGLQTNVRNTVGMVCRPCREARARADKAYTRRTTRERRSFKEQQREWVSCPELRGPTQDAPYDLIVWYVSKIIYLS